MSLALPGHVEEHVAYTANIAKRAEQVLNDQFRILDAAGVSYDRTAVLVVCSKLTALSAGLSLRQLQSQEARKSGL